MAQFTDHLDFGDWRGTGTIHIVRKGGSATGALAIRADGGMINLTSGHATPHVENYMPGNLQCASHGCPVDNTTDTRYMRHRHNAGCHNERGARLCDHTCVPMIVAPYAHTVRHWNANGRQMLTQGARITFNLYRFSERKSCAWVTTNEPVSEPSRDVVNHDDYMPANDPADTATDTAQTPLTPDDINPGSTDWRSIAQDIAAQSHTVDVPAMTPDDVQDILDNAAGTASAVAQVSASIAKLSTVDRIVRMLSARQHDGHPVNVNMIGPAGCGKTTMARMVAERMGVTFRVLKFTVNTLPHEVMGRDVPTPDGGLSFKGTAFTESYIHGGLLLLDEFDCADPNTATILHEPLANGHCTIDSVEHARRDDFYVLAACNTYGSGDRVYVGREVMDEATLSRFVPYTVDYDPEYEAGILAQCADLQRDALRDFTQRIRTAINNGRLRRTFSTRHMIQWVALINVGETLTDLSAEYFKAWSETDRRAARDAGIHIG